jgi:hypothetical protein
MSYYRFAEMVVALCFGLTFARRLVGNSRTDLARRVLRPRRRVAGSHFGNVSRLCNSHRGSRRSL